VRSNAEAKSLNAPGNYTAYFVILVQLLWSRLVAISFIFVSRLFLDKYCARNSYGNYLTYSIIIEYSSSPVHIVTGKFKWQLIHLLNVTPQCKSLRR
jgi:hypothetical protein